MTCGIINQGGIRNMNVSYHIRERKGKKGVYQIVVELPINHANGKRKRKYKTVHGSKKTVEQVARQMVHQIESNTYVAPNKMSVADMMNMWYDMYLNDKSPTTLNGYRYQIDNYIIPILGDYRIQDISALQIQQWVNSISENSPITNEPLSAKTVRNIFLNLSAALNRAVVLGLINKNPCENVILPKVKKYEAKIYDESGIRRLIECAKGTDMEVPIMLELSLGLRRGEIIALRWENVDFKNKLVNICENRVEGKNGEVITKAPKSAAGIRTIPLSDSLIHMLKEHYRRFLKIKLEYGIGYNKDDYVICQSNGLPYKPYSFTKKFRKLLEKNNLEHIRLHDLRHLNASIMLSQGISPKVAQQRLGHSDFSTTMNIYSHVMKSVENEAAQKLDDMLFG